MKKAILGICTFLIISTTASAQLKTFRLGLKAAPNLAWIKSDTKELKSDGVKLGFSFGLMADLRLGKDTYALSTGLFLNIVGANQRSTIFTEQDSQGLDVVVDRSLEFTRRYQYVEVPITIKLKTNEIGYMTYFGQIGFGTAYNVKAVSQVYTLDASRMPVPTEDVNVMDQTSFFRASLIVGAGMEYNIAGATSILVGVNYNNGFTDTFNKSVLLDVVEQHGKLHYVELNLGVFF